MFEALATALTQAYRQFTDAPLTIRPFGEGLIHETLLVSQLDKKWILQGFNDSVFRFPERIDHNLGLLSKHAAIHPLPFQLPLPLPNVKGRGLTAIQGKNYRLFDFVDGSTLQQVQHPAQARMAAQAYGKFASWSQQLSAEEFEETIPNFHRLDLRFARLEEVAKQLTAIPEEEQSLLKGYLEQLPLVNWYQEQRSQLPFELPTATPKSTT